MEIDMNAIIQSYDDDDRDAQHITSETDESLHAAIPFDVSMYLDRYRDSLDARRFPALRYVDRRRLFVDVAGIEVLKTSVHAWRERFHHWGGRGTEHLLMLRHPIDMPFARCEEEVRYVRRVAELSTALVESNEQVSHALELCFLDRPFDLAWFAGEGSLQAQHWLPDLDTKWHLRHRRCGWDRIFDGWHNVENFSIRERDRTQL